MPPPDDDSYQPADGSSGEGLPDLPPEWGTIVVPDDPAELAAEATEVRRELRRQAMRNQLRKLVGLGPSRPDATSLGVPIVIMTVAVITTLVSLFVVSWDQARSTAPVGPEALQQTALPLTDVTLTDAAGTRVRLGDVLPAMLLLVDDCDCPELISDIAAIAPKPVLIVPISAEPACARRARNVWCLTDPSGSVTGRYPTPTVPPSAASAEPTPGAGTEPTDTGADPSDSDQTQADQGGADQAGTDQGTDPAGLDPSASASPVAARPPVALAVPIDAYGVAHDPIVVTSADDLAEALTKLAAGQ